MPSHYTDSDDNRRSRSPGDHGMAHSGGVPASYTDRFRTDGAYDTPRGLHGSGASSIPRMLQLIERACRPSLKEPDLSLMLQIADIINEKKGNAPREAAAAIVELVNSRSPHTAVLAIAVLDFCVKNCGYPFHLQISRKEFLNSLVRRFPEKPPLHYSRVQLLILQCIEEWTVTLAKTSKYRDDLGYIRDMHRLLSYKGYMFPEVNVDDAAVLTANEDSLKSAAELEEEDRMVREAKLQELIRSGKPEDIREANQLMSIMAGFKEMDVDYHAKVAKELDKLRRKAEILEEMIANAIPGEPLANNDVFSEIVGSLKTSLPKLDKIIRDEGAADPDAKTKVEALKSYVQSLVAKYDLMAKGDFNGAADVEMTSLASGNKIDTSRQAVINSLIDIDDMEPAAATSQSGDDLLGLSFGGLTLGGSTPGTSAPASATPTQSSGNDLLGLSGSSTPVSRPDSSVPASDSLIGDFGAPASSTASPATPSTPAASASDKEHTIFEDPTLKIVLAVSKQGSDTIVVARFSNPSDKKVTNLKFEAAQPKSWTLAIDPQSGTQLEARQVNGVTQTLRMSGSGKPRLRWRLSYNWGIEPRTATGDAKDL